MFGNKVGHLGRVGSLTLAQRVSAMFSRGEPGAWYDPSDMSTLFQDSAGTTPVTAVEQPVGRILDKSGRGNHATQATTTKRPVLSRRVNMALLSGYGGWPASAPVRSSGVSPSTEVVVPAHTTSIRIDTTAGQQFAYGGASATVPGNTDMFLSYYIRRGDYSPVLLENCYAAVGNNPIITERALAEVSPGVYRFSCRATSLSSALGNTGVVLIGGTGVYYVSGLHVCHYVDKNLPYQSVNTATDYDADPNKFPAYLRFDGVDDALQTGNIDFTSTDKMTVWAGMTKLSDSTGAYMLSSSASPAATNGSFAVLAPQDAGGNTATFLAKGTTPFYQAFAFGLTSPVNFSLTGQASLSDATNSIRINGAIKNSTTSGSSGGNYGNYPLFIGALAGVGYFFNGRLYSLIVRGAQTPLSRIEATELYIKQKMRMP